MVDTNRNPKQPRLSQNDAIYNTKKSFRQVSRRKSESAMDKLKLEIPPHHLEPKTTGHFPTRNDAKSGALFLSKNMFLRRHKEYWFVLNCDLSHFSYYKSRQECFLGYAPVGYIDISKCSILIDPEVKGQFILSENRFKTYKLVASSDTERSSWIHAIQIQRDYWNKSKKSLNLLRDPNQLTLSDSHRLTSSYKDLIHERPNSNVDRSPLSPKSARKFFARQFSGEEFSFKERSSSLGRSHANRPFTISFRKSGSRKGLFSPYKAESVENVEIGFSDELFVPPHTNSFTKSPLNDIRNDLTRSVSFDTMRKPSPLPEAGKKDSNLVQDAKGDVYAKNSAGYFLDEDLSDEETSLDYSSQPSTLLGAQLIIRNCQRDKREANLEIERLKSREQGYKDLLKHRDDQLLSLEEQVEERALDKTGGTTVLAKQSSTAHSRMIREMQETGRQLEQERRDKGLMHVEVQNLERLVFKKDADMQLASDRYDNAKNAMRIQRDRHLTLIGYAMTHILGSRHLIVPEFFKDGQTEIQEYSLEEKLHSDIAWLWRQCRNEDPVLPDLNDNVATFQDKHGDTLEPSQDDPASILDAVRYLTDHLQISPSPIYYQIPFKDKKEMKRLARKGFPDVFRKSVWMYAIRLQVNIIRKTHPKNIYEQLVAEALNEGSPYKRDIDLDLYRTFPSNVKFRDDSDSIPALRRILLAYSLFDPKIGYCQGMNMLVGIALQVLTEEDAFWCLVTILQKLMPENYFSGSLLGAIADQMVLSDLIKEKIPKLGQHMDRFGIEPHLICLNWFITVFADVMPTDIVLKIWDSFLLDGRKSIFRYSLAILQFHEHILLTKEDPILLHNYIRTVCSHWIDFELLRNVTFTKFKTFPKTSKLDEYHKAHLNPLIIENETKERKLQQQKKHNIPISHSKLLMPQTTSFVAPKLSNASVKSRDERKWECGAVLPVSNHGHLLCASDRTHTSLYMVTPDKNSESLEDKHICRALDLEIGSDVCCVIEIHIFWIVGTSNGLLYGIDRVSKQMLWKCDLKESPLCLFYPNSDVSNTDRLFLGLANGNLHSFTLEGLPTTLKDGLSLPELFPSDMVIIGLGNEPISCLESPGDGIICCGVGGRICVFETDTTQQLYEMVVSSEKRRSIREMRTSKHGLWISLKGSCNILLYRIERDSHSLIYRIDYNCYIQPSIEFAKTTSGHSTLPLTKKEARATALLARGDELWIGTHNGNLLVFDIKREEKDALELMPRLDHSASLFQVSDEFPLELIPGSSERQVVTSLTLSTVEKLSNYPVRVLLGCDAGENGKVLSASGTVGEKGSVRVWDNTSSHNYQSYHLPIKPFEVVLDLPTNGEKDEYVIQGFDYCGIFFTSEAANGTPPLSPITENIIDESEFAV